MQEYQRGITLGGVPLPLQVVLAMSKRPCLESSERDERTWLGAVAGETAERLPTGNRQQWHEQWQQHISLTRMTARLQPCKQYINRAVLQRLNRTNFLLWEGRMIT